MFGDGRQVPMFREVLSKESVDALVQHMLPVGIRMREVDASLKVTGHSLMVDKFQTIVIGDGIHPVLIQGEALCDHVTNSLGRLSEARTDDGIPRFALDQRHQGALPGGPCQSRCHPPSRCRAVVTTVLIRQCAGYPRSDPAGRHCGKSDRGCTSGDRDARLSVRHILAVQPTAVFDASDEAPRFRLGRRLTNCVKHCW